MNNQCQFGFLFFDKLMQNSTVTTILFKFSKKQKKKIFFYFNIKKKKFKRSICNVNEQLWPDKIDNSFTRFIFHNVIDSVWSVFGFNFEFKKQKLKIESKSSYFHILWSIPFLWIEIKLTNVIPQWIRSL